MEDFTLDDLNSEMSSIFDLTSDQKVVLRLAFKLVDALVRTADTVAIGGEYIDANSVFEVRERLEKVFKTDLE